MKAKKHGVANNKNALKDISEDEVLKLSERFWTKSEIAAFCNCHVDTITNRFQEIYLKGRENGKAKLRDLQLAQANKGNVTMLIWLGKQYLGQTDKTETDSTLNVQEAEALKSLVKAEIQNNL